MERNEKLTDLLTIKQKPLPPKPGTSWTQPLEKSKVLEKVKTFLPKINDANDRLKLSESTNDDYLITQEESSSSSSDESDTEKTTVDQQKPVVKMDVVVFQYDDQSSASEESSSLSSSDSECCTESKERKKKLRLKMPDESNVNKSKRRCLIEEIKDLPKQN